MKNLICAALILVMALPVDAQFTRARLQATGLTCAMCSNAINKALKKVSFVETVKSDIKNSAFDIVFKQDQPVDIDHIKDAVEDAGFSVGSLKLTGTFNGIKIASEQHVQIGQEQFCFLNVPDKTLEGEETITVLDKNFVTAKEFKKMSSSGKMDCLQPSKSNVCCGAGLPAGNARIYHVTI
jgi:copper chaperone CopZ